MIETVINNNLENLLNLFVWTGVILTAAAGVFITKIAAEHDL